MGRKAAMLWGLFLLAASTLLFAFADSYPILLVARFAQGIAGASNMTGGMALLADVFPDPVLRGKHMGRAMMGNYSTYR